jgi:dolichol-phosphate mannosyltransferase
MTSDLDIVIPVYNEGPNILATLGGIIREAKSPKRVLICYDLPDDDTLPAIKNNPDRVAGLDIEFVCNPGSGVHDAVMAGLAASQAPYVIVYPADDDFNAGTVDAMVARARDGYDIVCASRFMPGGKMEGCPWLKGVLVRTAAFLLHRLARLPTFDPTNGFRLYSRRVIDRIAVESDRGFCHAVELLVKTHRLGWPVAEVPAVWFERKHGTSRFQVVKWLPAYLRWFRYGFATTFLRRQPESVAMKTGKV